MTKTASKIFYISINTLIEAFKDRLVTSLVVTGILLIAGADLLASLSFVERRKIIMDIGLTTIFAIGILLAIFASTNLLVREVETRRILCVFSKPVRRSYFIIGKYLGICLTVFITVFLLSVVLLIFVKFETGFWEFAIFTHALLVCFELLLLSALALFFSSFTTQFLGIFYSILILIGGHMMGDVRVYTGSTRVSSQVFSKLMNFFFPNLQIFNLKGAIVHHVPIDAAYLYLAALYACAFAILFVVAAVFIFSSRDFNK